MMGIHEIEWSGTEGLKEMEWMPRRESIEDHSTNFFPRVRFIFIAFFKRRTRSFSMFPFSLSVMEFNWMRPADMLPCPPARPSFPTTR